MSNLKVRGFPARLIERSSLVQISSIILLQMSGWFQAIRFQIDKLVLSQTTRLREFTQQYKYLYAAVQ